jgi:hypothetical protein
MIDATGFKEEFLDEFSKLNKEEMIQWFDNAEKEDNKNKIKVMRDKTKTKRIERRNITNGEIGYKSAGGLFDLFDNAVKSFARINDEQYDFILERAEDNEMDLLIKEEYSFAEKRQLITMLEKYLVEFKNYRDDTK